MKILLPLLLCMAVAGCGDSKKEAKAQVISDLIRAAMDVENTRWDAEQREATRADGEEYRDALDRCREAMARGRALGIPETELKSASENGKASGKKLAASKEDLRRDFEAIHQRAADARMSR